MTISQLPDEEFLKDVEARCAGAEGPEFTGAEMMRLATMSGGGLQMDPALKLRWHAPNIMQYVQLATALLAAKKAETNEHA